MLSVKDEYTFRVFNFLMIAFCNSSANYFVDIILFSTTPPAFLSKNLSTTEGSPHCHPSYFGFSAILNALSCNILSEAVLLVKSLKSP